MYKVKRFSKKGEDSSKKNGSQEIKTSANLGKGLAIGGLGTSVGAATDIVKRVYPKVDKVIELEGKADGLINKGGYHIANSKAFLHEGANKNSIRHGNELKAEGERLVKLGKKAKKVAKKVHDRLNRIHNVEAGLALAGVTAATAGTGMYIGNKLDNRKRRSKLKESESNN